MKRPFIQFYSADFIADVTHISGEAAAVYSLMLIYAWQAGGKLPANEKDLRKLLRIDWKSWQRVKHEALQFWELGENEVLTNPRQRRDLAENIPQKFRKSSSEVTQNVPQKCLTSFTNPNKINGSASFPRARARTHNHKERVLFSELSQEKGKSPEPINLKDDTMAEPLVYVKAETPQWEAWEAWYRKAYPGKLSHPKSFRKDPEGGWFFPSEWPPGCEQLEKG